MSKKLTLTRILMKHGVRSLPALLIAWIPKHNELVKGLVGRGKFSAVVNAIL